MEKLYISKTFSKMAGGRMHTPHPTPLNPPLAISYKNHQKTLAYFSHLAPLAPAKITIKERNMTSLDMTQERIPLWIRHKKDFLAAYLSSCHDNAIKAL